MNNQGNLGITTGILLIGFLLIGAVSASVIINTTQTVSSDKDLNKITNEVVDKICSYIEIKDIVGKFQQVQGQQKITQLLILINPLISQQIDIKHMTIKLTDGEQLRFLYFNGNVNTVNSYSLFDHPSWNTITPDTYSILSVIDDDGSITSSHVFNKNTDLAFIQIKLSPEAALIKGDSLQITILPSPGMERTVTIEAPLPTTHVVTLL
jgi:archaellin